MLTIRITYLTGRVYSSSFEDGDRRTAPEWPPHPSRLFSAMVAAWADSGADQDLRKALEWLECQPAPKIHAGQCSPRTTQQSYVPVNDSSELPDQRSRKPRGFPSASLVDPNVYFVWEAEPPAEVLNSLHAILSRTSALGHSASLVEAAVEPVPPQGAEDWRPDDVGSLRLRVPAPNRLHELTASYERFVRTGAKVNRPSRGASALYKGFAPLEPTIAGGVFDRMIILRRDAGPRASLRSTLSITAALRGAAMTYAPQPPAGFLTGHAPESTPEQPARSEQPHVAFVPLAFAGSDHATGEVLGLAALLPDVLDDGQAALCWDLMARIQTLSMPWGEWQVSLADAEERRAALRPENWTRPSDLWSTITPLVLDRYPEEPYGEDAKSIVATALTRAGFPEPAELELHYNPWQRGAPKASLFPPAPSRPGKPRRFHCHVWARFDRRVRGPMVAGAGRFYGYGLFRPLYERDAR